MQPGLLPLCECPNCRTRADLTVFLAATEPQEALMALVETNPQMKAFIKPMMFYVRLFVPEGEEIGFRMMTRLFYELAAIINKGTVEKNGYTYKVTPSMWAQAFQAVRETKNLDLPLTSHAYYLGVVGNLAREHDKKSHGASASRGSKPSSTSSSSSAAATAVRMPTEEEKQRAIEHKARIDKLLKKSIKVVT